MARWQGWRRDGGEKCVVSKEAFLHLSPCGRSFSSPALSRKSNSTPPAIDPSSNASLQPSSSTPASVSQPDLCSHAPPPCSPQSTSSSIYTCIYSRATTTVVKLNWTAYLRYRYREALIIRPTGLLDNRLYLSLHFRKDSVSIFLHGPRISR